MFGLKEVGNALHTTELYEVRVATFPGDNELPTYVILNKNTNVVEYSHSVLFYATQWADQFTSLMTGKEPEGDEALPTIQ